MTDEQRAGLARDHMEKAAQLIDKLVAAGAGELEGTRESVIDVIEVLDELDFEEGNLVSELEPVAAIAYADDDDDDDVSEFREDSEEE